jgi:hypothetical protein
VGPPAASIAAMSMFQVVHRCQLRSHVEFEVREAVVHDADGGRREAIGDVDGRRRDDRVVEDDALGVEVVRPYDDAAAHRVDSCVCAGVADYRTSPNWLRGPTTSASLTCTRIASTLS